MKRKGRSSNSFPCFTRHPFPGPRHPTCAMLILLTVLLYGLVGLGPPAGAEQSPKSTHEDDFLLFGTVFNEQGLALPGARVRVRRAGERKVRWEAQSDRRGEFGVRVPRGAEYEMNVRASGYPEQRRKLDARTGSREDLVFRMQRGKGEKPK
jgi:hypothetical protein